MVGFVSDLNIKKFIHEKTRFVNTKKNELGCDQTYTQFLGVNPGKFQTQVRLAESSNQKSILDVIAR